MRRATRLAGLLPLLAIVAACGDAAIRSTPGQTSAPSTGIAAVIDEYRETIPRLMREHYVPALAVAVVDDTGIVWTEGFGSTGGGGSRPVTPDTIFSIQSMSKAFTATGVLLAVQDGLLDLDEPITTYLPEFKVNSIFEEHPEDRITLRHLLSHTAGLPYEAPVGNNWDADADSFQAHIDSIADTWLRFPVGGAYAYGNPSIDLAGYILQEVTGQPFADWQRDHLLEPLGMANSSFDADVIRANDNRAIGHGEAISGYVPVPMIPAGGMYASANDLARFLQFQLGEGTIDGERLLDPALIDEMRTVQYPDRGERYGYGLGVARTGWYRGRNADLFSHGGAGFGFLADLWWLPELQLGIAVLTNSSEHDLQGTLALGILDDLVHTQGLYADRLRELPMKSPVEETDGHWLAPPSLAADIRALALPPDPDGWHDLLGQYKTANLDVIDPSTPPSRVYEENGKLYFDGSDTDDPTSQLFEIQPGLYFTETGDALDFRADPPTFRNLPLTKVGDGPPLLVRALLAICGLVMAAWLLAPPARWLRRRASRHSVEGQQREAGRSTGTAVAALAAATSLCGLAALTLLVVYPRIVYSGYLGWLDVPGLQKLWLRSPLWLAIFAVAMTVLAVPSLRHRWRDRDRWLQDGLIAAAAIEVTFLASWGMIGIA